MNIDVTNVIRAELRKIHIRSHFDRAPAKEEFPFVTFKAPSTFQGEDTTENIMVEVDVWDNRGNNIAELESITKDISKEFHKKTYEDEKMFLIFERESLLNIPDPEEQIRRRQIRFKVKYYNREE
jgi:hypothetical protein